MNLIETLTQVRTETALQPESLWLSLPQQTFEIQSNSQNLLNILAAYFQSNVCNPQQADVVITAIESDQFITIGNHWTDWPRPTGKAGRKDTILDLDQDRFVFKVKTGMLFWQNSKAPLAIGPTEAYPNQIINFILTQNLNWHQQQGWILGHCAGLQIQQQGIAIAGLSGGGKSTLMLHLLDQGEHFISNDRLLFIRQNQSVLMRGIPKQPRINPGTIVHNPKLRPLISEQQRLDYLSMPNEELRQLEHKYDADVNELYGADCYLAETRLNALIILNWQVHTEAPTRLISTTLAESPHLLPAIIKSAGPFYSDADGAFLKTEMALEENMDSDAYLNVLGDIPCWELQGQVNFEQAVSLILEKLASRR